MTEPLGRSNDYLQPNTKYQKADIRDQLLKKRTLDAKVFPDNPLEKHEILKVASSTEAQKK